MLVDLNGHTKGSGLPIMRYRAAPVQVSYLGYPATTGAAFVDFYLCDAQAAEASQVARDGFTERVALLPPHVSYMANDHAQMHGHVLNTMAWAEERAREDFLKRRRLLLRNQSSSAGLGGELKGFAINGGGEEVGGKESGLEDALVLALLERGRRREASGLQNIIVRKRMEAAAKASGANVEHNQELSAGQGVEEGATDWKTGKARPFLGGSRGPLSDDVRYLITASQFSFTNQVAQSCYRICALTRIQFQSIPGGGPGLIQQLEQNERRYFFCVGCNFAACFSGISLAAGVRPVNHRHRQPRG